LDARSFQASAIQTHNPESILPTGDVRVDRVLAIAQKRYSDADLSLKTMVPELNISEQHLGRLFKNRTGMTFRQHLRNLRIQKAAERLATSFEEIKTIAGAVGYLDQSHFGKDFREIMGTSPREFRAAPLGQKFLNIQFVRIKPNSLE
jgi:transcriptional regulator GlxA family with amidase domain